MSKAEQKIADVMNIMNNVIERARETVEEARRHGNLGYADAIDHLADAIDDMDKFLGIQKKCTACNGSGHYDHNGSPPCGACDGKGSV